MRPSNFSRYHIFLKLLIYDDMLVSPFIYQNCSFSIEYVLEGLSLKSLISIPSLNISTTNLGGFFTTPAHGSCHESKSVVSILIFFLVPWISYHMKHVNVVYKTLN